MAARPGCGRYAARQTQELSKVIVVGVLPSHHHLTARLRSRGHSCRSHSRPRTCGGAWLTSVASLTRTNFTVGCSDSCAIEISLFSRDHRGRVVDQSCQVVPTLSPEPYTQRFLRAPIRNSTMELRFHSRCKSKIRSRFEPIPSCMRFAQNGAQLIKRTQSPRSRTVAGSLAWTVARD